MEKKQKSSPDYASLVRGLLEQWQQTSGDTSEGGGISKLPAGLYIVATPIGHLGDITLRALLTLLQADMIAAEDTRNSGQLLAGYGLKKPLIPYHDHNAEAAEPRLIAELRAGKSVALVSDAGMPLIADPGFGLVRACRDQGIPVTVIPGPCALVTALAGAGLPTDRFTFSGFLPAKAAARRSAIEELAALPGTQVLYESPQRLTAALADLAVGLGADRPAAVARELTKLYEETRSGTLSELAAHYAEAEVRGEIVIVIGPGAPPAGASAADLDTLLRDALASQSLRDAVATVTAITGAKKAAVYARALALAKAGAA